MVLTYVLTKSVNVYKLHEQGIMYETLYETKKLPYNDFMKHEIIASGLKTLGNLSLETRKHVRL